MAILKDQPRSTSAIASNRCVLLSLDRNEFLHLISYGNSNIDGSSIDEEDRRFNDIISKYIGEWVCRNMGERPISGFFFLLFGWRGKPKSELV